MIAVIIYNKKLSYRREMALQCILHIQVLHWVAASRTFLMVCTSGRQDNAWIQVPTLRLCGKSSHQMLTSKLSQRWNTPTGIRDNLTTKMMFSRAWLYGAVILIHGTIHHAAADLVLFANSIFRQVVNSLTVLVNWSKKSLPNNVTTDTYWYWYFIKNHATNVHGYS